ncbi:MAG: serine/threonine protein kinase [Claussenomyces sp. TS43310]|nr:MAG: serine/threonine protein kinase [Claussenomyces sp. TS43310]
MSTRNDDEDPASVSAGTSKPGEVKPVDGIPAVRFKSQLEEINPKAADQALKQVSSRDVSGETEAELRALTQTLHGVQLQNSRMGGYKFEPVSLPASRVPSQDYNSQDSSRQHTHDSSSRHSPRESLQSSVLHSPPLTPAASQSKDSADAKAKGAPLEKVEAEATQGPSITPPGTSRSSSENIPSSRPGSSGHFSTRPTTVSAEMGAATQAHRAAFSIGPESISSVPPSRDASPTRAYPATSYSRPMTSGGDANDPYAASKRPPQPKNLNSIEPRFVFSGRSSRPRHSPRSSSTTLPRSAKGTLDSHKKDNQTQVPDDSSDTLHNKHGSMANLKRFIKFPGHSKSKRNSSPHQSGTRTPPHHKTPQQLPFGDDHGLNARYGKFGKVLGAGAGGSVRLMKRSTDGVTFAVKEFRARHTYESEKEYAKKVTAEFCVGSSLHHCNIIETMDIIQEKGKWYEVMEYAPYDLFAIVMTGKMSREEITCSFLQILSGVTYLHSLGLAHRDLKLDNVVVNEHGIMKIIDFGSASVFQYPFENEVVLASGIVGSDPYLAPEVYDEQKYDPRPADIWSLAIIYCCMVLRRFPWKMPRVTDHSYKLFAATPSPGADKARLEESSSQAKSSTDASTTTKDSHNATSAPAEKIMSDRERSNAAAAGHLEEKKPEVIKGPWRLLRLMPRESRQIIGRMLVIDPKDRATMHEILSNPWVAETPICRQEADGRGAVIRVEGHTHTLEPPTPPPAPAK